MSLYISVRILQVLSSAAQNALKFVDFNLKVENFNVCPSLTFTECAQIADSVGDDLNQMIYKSQFKSFTTTYDFDLNQFASHGS